MTESTIEPGSFLNRKLSRRQMNLFLAGAATAATVTAVSQSPMGHLIHDAVSMVSQEMTRPSQNTIRYEYPVHKIANMEMEFAPWEIDGADPYINENGEIFDLHSGAYVSQNTEGLIPLRNTSPFPAAWARRDIVITPELVMQDKPLQKIVTDAENKIEIWNKNLNKTPNASVFLPSTLLKTRVVSRSLADELVYKFFKPEEFSKLSLAERLEQGITNCVEFSLMSSLAFARFGINSEIINFGWEKSDGKQAMHAVNVLNVDGCCVVNDATANADNIKTFSEYMTDIQQTFGRIITPRIIYTSIEANHEVFPWDDNSWVTKEMSLGIQAAYTSSIR